MQPGDEKVIEFQDPFAARHGAASRRARYPWLKLRNDGRILYISYPVEVVNDDEV